MRLEKSFLILTTMLKEIKNNFYTKLKKNFLISLLIPFFILLGMVISYKIFSPMLSAIINGNKEMFLSFISSGMINVTLITFVLYLILINSNNENANYNRTLRWLPISRHEKILARILQELIFIFLITTAYAIFFHFPALILSGIGIKIILVYLFLVNIQSFITYLLLNSMYILITRVLYLFSHKKIIKELSTIILGVTFFIYFIDKFNIKTILIQNREIKISLLNILLPIVDLFNDNNYFDNNLIIFSFSSLCIIVVLGLSLIFLLDNIELNNRNLKLFKYIPKNDSKFTWIVVKEIKQIIRSDVNISNLVVLVGIVISMLLLDKLSINPSLINLFVSSFCSIFALNSFGEDNSFKVYSNIVPISSTLVSYSKLLGNIIFSFLTYIALYLLMSIKLGFQFNTLRTGILYVIVGTILIFSYGILVPIKEKEPFSNIIVFTSFTIIIILLSIIISYCTTYIYEAIGLLTLCDIIAIPSLYRFKSRES